MPEDYRSEWCKDFFDPKGCPRGVHCPFAHNLQQLRIDAAIKKGTVREDFKLNFCADEHQRGTLCFIWSYLMWIGKITGSNNRKHRYSEAWIH